MSTKPIQRKGAAQTDEERDTGRERERLENYLMDLLIAAALDEEAQRTRPPDTGPPPAEDEPRRP